MIPTSDSSAMRGDMPENRPRQDEAIGGDRAG